MTDNQFDLLHSLAATGGQTIYHAANQLGRKYPSLTLEQAIEREANKLMNG